MASGTTGVGRSTRCAQSPLIDNEEAAWLGLLCKHAPVLSALDRELERAERLSVTAFAVLFLMKRRGRPGCA
jgi:hypothetical protein